MNKTEWLSLELHSQKVSDLVSRSKAAEDYSELLLVQELESELLSMKTMTSLVLSQICCNPVDLVRLEGRS